MFYRILLCRKALVMTLVVTLGFSQVLLTAQGAVQSGRTAQISGELSLTGSVTINGNAAAPGDTVMNDTVLRTDCNATAAVNLGKQGRIELGPGSEMVLSLSTGTVGGNLRSGSVTLSVPASVAVSVATSDGMVTSSGNEVAVVTIDLGLGNTRVIAKRSDARITSGSKVEYVAAGQEAAVGVQNPGQGTRCTRLSAAGSGSSSGGVPAALSAGALTALILAGVGGAVAGIVAATQSDSVSPGQIFVSTFTP